MGRKNGSTDFHCYDQEDYSASSAGVADAIQTVKGSVDSSELYLLGYSQGGWMASKGKELVGTGKLAVGVWQPGKDEKFGTKPDSSTLATEPGQEDAIFYIRDKTVLDNLGLVNN